MKLGLSRNNILDYFAIVFFMSLPFPRNFSTTAIVFILLYSFWRIIKDKSLPDIKWNWFLPLLFLYYIVSNLLSGGLWSAMEKRLLLVVIPIMFWLNPGFYKTDLKLKFYWGYISGILLSEFICLLVAIKHSVSLVEGNLIFNPKVFPDADYDFLTAAIRDGNYFFSRDFSLFLDPIYFGIYIVLAQFFIFELFKKTTIKYQKASLFILYASQFIFLFLLSSKGAIFSSLILSFYQFWNIGLPRFLKITAVLGVASLSIFFMSLNPRMRVFSDTFIERLSINPNARFGHDLRILSWDASLDVIKRNWLYGVGEGNKDSILNAKYIEKGYVFPAKEELNSHNQYLDFLIGGGLIGLGIYMWGLTGLLLKAIRGSVINYPLLVFLFLFSFEALFENLLSRHAGVLLFAVFATYLNTSKHEAKFK